MQAAMPNTCTAVAPLPKGMLWPSVTSADGKLYVFGGPGDPSCTTFGRTFEAYDPHTNTWTVLGDMPDVLAGLPSATTGLDGRIYLYGFPESGTSAVVFV